MLRRFCVILFAGALLKLTQCAPAAAAPAKGRAYEFGFEIDQNQHRHEKRDENGIVMGEFGFITADGIYHVTVYATDENGRFKILAMKSYPYGNREKKMMIAMIPSIRKTVAVPAIVKAMPTDTKSCGGCILTKKLVPLPASVAAPMPGAQVFKPLSKAINGATPSTPSRPSSIPLPPRLPSVPSLQLKPNAIGSGQPKATLGSSKNGKPVQSFGQIPGDRQNKAQGTPQQIDVRLGSPKQPNKVATVGPQNKQGNKPSVGGTFNPLVPGDRQNKAQGTPQQTDVRLGSPKQPNKVATVGPQNKQGNKPTVGGTFNPLFRNPFNSPANNINLSQQETQSTLNTFTPKPFQLVNNVLPNGQSYVNTALPTLSRPANTIFQQAPLTPNTSFQQAPLTPNTSFQQAPLTPNTRFQAPRPDVLIPPFHSDNALTQPQLTNRYSQKPNGKSPLHTTIYTPTLSNKTPTRNTIQPSNTPTLLQQTGFVSTPSSVLPQLTNVRRPTPTLTNGGIPLGLHKQNTNGAQTPTSKLPSTQKLTPSSQSIGKTTPSTNNGGGPLYRFNYVLDYNSHREEGRLDGSKEGNYKTIGEDGIRSIIDYIANENGYQPHIKWEPVPPNELPTGENKLKEYEFVWFN